MGRPPSENPRKKRVVGYFTEQEFADFRAAAKARLPRLSLSDAIREISMEWVGTHAEGDIINPPSETVSRSARPTPKPRFRP